MIRTLLQVGIPIFIGIGIVRLIGGPEILGILIGFVLAAVTDLVVRYFMFKIETGEWPISRITGFQWQWIWKSQYGMVLHKLFPIPLWIFLAWGAFFAVVKVVGWE